MTGSTILICTDLDRTLIPNDVQPESTGAREMFNELVSQSHVSLAYVTGRHRELVEDAIKQYQLPQPDYVICNVGTTIYQVDSGGWSELEQWQWEIGRSWAGMKHDDISSLLSEFGELTLQEEEKQNRYKLSYYVPIHCEREMLEQKVVACLKAEGIKAALVWSVDTQIPIGLLDVLPEVATKQHAIEFLMEQKGFKLDNTIFAGDSGNDIAVLTSPIKSVLVANASDDVRRMAIQDAAEKIQTDALYLAHGGFKGMNGNYSAGILEGIAHYLPHLEEVLEK